MEHNNNIAFSPELQYVKQLIAFRLKNRFVNKNDDSESLESGNPTLPQFPPLNTWWLSIKKFIETNYPSFTNEEITLLLIALIPHVCPNFFDDCFSQFIDQRSNYNKEMPEVGGVRGKNSRFFLPTGETAIFLIGGNDFSRRRKLRQLFIAEHVFWQKKILWLEDMQGNEPAMHGQLIMSPTYVDLLGYDNIESLPLRLNFPVRRITGHSGYKRTLDEFIGPHSLKIQIEHIARWLRHEDETHSKIATKYRIRPGYKALFHGPSGTGKTLAAEILGNFLEKDVFKIDLSMIVSKYIGETEKNLELLFTSAEAKRWILLFDEADALFGKRSNVKNSHDRYANQEASYLLQLIEDYNGLIIFATNVKNNFDDAFIRRFNSIIKFPFPNAKQRELIWNRILPPNAIFKKKKSRDKENQSVNIPETVKKYPLSGGEINRALHYATMKAIEEDHESQIDGSMIVYLTDVLAGIKMELKKGKRF